MAALEPALKVHPEHQVRKLELRVWQLLECSSSARVDKFVPGGDSVNLRKVWRRDLGARVYPGRAEPALKVHPEHQVPTLSLDSHARPFARNPLSCTRNLKIVPTHLYSLPTFPCMTLYSLPTVPRTARNPEPSTQNSKS